MPEALGSPPPVSSRAGGRRWGKLLRVVEEKVKYKNDKKEYFVEEIENQ